MNIPGNGDDPLREPAGGPTRRPGHELGAAREREGISLEDMAARLNLTRDSVEAIERDDYQHLPTAAFVRGYLRAYAREVGMDGDELVAEFDALCGEGTEPELVLSEGVPDPASGRGPVIAVLILAAVVVIGAGAWWMQQEPAMGPGFDQVVSGDGIAEDGPETVAEDEPVEREQDTAVDAGDAPTDMATDSTAAGAEAQESADADQAPSGETAGGTGGGAEGDAASDADTGEAASAQQATDAAPTDEVQPADAAQSVEGAQTGGETATAETEPEGPLATSSAAAAATTAAATGPDRLEITVDGESWLEVYDSRGRRLAYTLYSGASPVVLNGWAPFEVFLGNAPAVTVRFGDRAIDPSAFVRSDNTARFLADSDGARQR